MHKRTVYLKSRYHNSSQRAFGAWKDALRSPHAQWLSTCDSREEALLRAHTESGLTMSAIAKELGLSVSRVSRLIARAEGAKEESSGANPH